jgi:hypothetical protein
VKRWALIDGEIVNMIVEQETQPQVFGYWVECSNNVGPGWVYADGQFSPPPPPEETAAE